MQSHKSLLQTVRQCALLTSTGQYQMTHYDYTVSFLDAADLQTAGITLGMMYHSPV